MDLHSPIPHCPNVNCMLNCGAFNSYAGKNSHSRPMTAILLKGLFARLAIQGSHHPLTDKRAPGGWMVHADSVVGTEHCFPSGSLEFWYMPGRGRQENLESWVSNELPWWTTLYSLSQLAAGGIKCILCGSTGRGSGSCSWSPPGSAPCAFSLCWLCFVSFGYNKSQPRRWPYAKSCETSKVC